MPLSEIAVSLRGKDGGDITIPARQVALVIVDMWDKHWCPRAERVFAGLPERIDAFARQVRQGGGLIVHAPAGTRKYYRQTAAYRRARRLWARLVRNRRLRVVFGGLTGAANADTVFVLPPKPIDDSGSGNKPAAWSRHYTGSKSAVRSRQHPAIWIDMENDIISIRGCEIFDFLARRGVTQVWFCGVALNFCVLQRPFGVCAALLQNKWRVAVVRDLTDIWCDPAKVPDDALPEARRLMVRYVEDNVCPTFAVAESIFK